MIANLNFHDKTKRFWVQNVIQPAAAIWLYPVYIVLQQYLTRFINWHGPAANKKKIKGESSLLQSMNGAKRTTVSQIYTPPHLMSLVSSLYYCNTVTVARAVCFFLHNFPMLFVAKYNMWSFNYFFFLIRTPWVAVFPLLIYVPMSITRCAKRNCNWNLFSSVSFGHVAQCIQSNL